MNIVDVDVSDREESRDNHIYWRSRLIAVLKSTTDGGMAIDDIVQSLSVRSHQEGDRVSNPLANYIATDTGVIKKKTNKPKVVLIFLAFVGFVALAHLISDIIGPASWLLIIIPCNLYFVFWLVVHHNRVCVQADKSLDKAAENMYDTNPAFRAKLYHLTKSKTTPEEAMLLARMLDIQGDDDQ